MIGPEMLRCLSAEKPMTPLVPDSESKEIEGAGPTQWRNGENGREEHMWSGNAEPRTAGTGSGFT